MLQDIVSYFSGNANHYFSLIGQHLLISLVSVLTALVIAVPLGIASAKARWAGALFTGLFSILRIIPSLAVLFLCISFLGVGETPAIVALCFLAFPPIFINTVLAFRSLPAPVLETAVAMGMRPWKLFYAVKLPLALPFMLAGMKTAIVEVISSATLAAYIGAGGLGEIIVTGLGLMRTDLLLIGGVSVAILSLASSFLLGRFEHYLLRYQRA